MFMQTGSEFHTKAAGWPSTSQEDKGIITIKFWNLMFNIYICFVTSFKFYGKLKL